MNFDQVAIDTIKVDYAYLIKSMIVCLEYNRTLTYWGQVRKRGPKVYRLMSTGVKIIMSKYAFKSLNKAIVNIDKIRMTSKLGY